MSAGLHAQHRQTPSFSGSDDHFAATTHYQQFNACQMHKSCVSDASAVPHVQRVYARQVDKGCVSDASAAAHVQRVYAMEVHKGGVPQRSAAQQTNVTHILQSCKVRCSEIWSITKVG